LSVLDKVRKWIDGDSTELVLEEAARDAQVKPRSRAEEFIVKIAKEVESVMQNEMVPLPQGTAIIPSEYTIFLNGDDDKEWQGVKRKGLEQGLYHILAERAREIAGKKKLETKSFVIELRIDGTLERGEIRVQHSWEESGSNKTGVLARPKNLPNIPPAPQQYQQAPPANVPVQTPFQPTPPAGVGVPTPYQQVPPANSPGQTAFEQAVPPTDPGFPVGVTPAQFPPTVQQARPAYPQQIPPSVPLQGEEGEEMTRVATRLTELYRLEVWRGGVRQNVVPIYQKEVVIGRGSKSKPVDIPLSGDAEISRRHLTLVTDGLGNYWAVNEGRNPAAVNNYELPAGQRISVTPGSALNICSYMLRIQPK
jgi:hypothetical protein